MHSPYKPHASYDRRLFIFKKPIVIDTDAIRRRHTAVHRRHSGNIRIAKTFSDVPSRVRMAKPSAPSITRHVVIYDMIGCPSFGPNGCHTYREERLSHIPRERSLLFSSVDPTYGSVDTQSASMKISTFKNHGDNNLGFN